MIKTIFLYQGQDFTNQLYDIKNGIPSLSNPYRLKRKCKKYVRNICHQATLFKTKREVKTILRTISSKQTDHQEIYPIERTQATNRPGTMVQKRRTNQQSYNQKESFSSKATSRKKYQRKKNLLLQSCHQSQYEPYHKQ